VRERARELMSGVACRAGIHLRKVRNPDVTSKLAADLVRVVADARRDRDVVFVASDPFSVNVKNELADLVKRRGFTLLEPRSLSAHPTRSTIEGILDAGVENTLLALCGALLPYEAGHSTYHDIALARLIWRQQLDADAVTSHIGNHTEHRRTVTPPISTCYHPWRDDDAAVF